MKMWKQLLVLTAMTLAFSQFAEAKQWKPFKALQRAFVPKQVIKTTPLAHTIKNKKT